MKGEIKDGNGRLARGEDEKRSILKEHFEDLYSHSGTVGSPHV